MGSEFKWVLGGRLLVFRHSEGNYYSRTCDLSKNRVANTRGSVKVVRTYVW